ncbi:cysteine-tryptophan domain-containing zinc finger protein 7 [Gossypium raimondii]|uniref:cysteine-tryptophan domain-containing zinc finger protein 7 n=1 Tax=Gossypium raimondii TaxID=29730 RepID=UPI00227CF35B|nr:cysteine-tryptophan domain-containing zinc finger protein 7 [Gossypium raimondii]XP_052477854.1 cysteine-tryptophan domain-containing zinc finger protein 7 [Gossypium raimondii]
MDENSEPEEGEACYHRDDDDDINPDTAFSYLDEKIKNILGHFQKDFEGGVSAENLGAKFGGYGSFLPTYERSPTRLSCPKTPQGNSSTPRSTNNLSMEGAFQNLKAPPNAPPSGRPGKATCPSGSIAAKHDSHLSFNHVAEKPALKDDRFNRAEIPTDQKTLKVRIKVGSDNKVQKNSAIYSGLGLDDSPSSSLGNSPEESGGTVMGSQGTTNESPTKILQVMTSYHVPGGVLISPLHESLLCLLRKEKEGPSRESKSIPLLKACPENSSGLIDESMLGNGKQLREKKTKFLIGKSKKVVESKQGNRMNVENDKKMLIKNKLQNENAGGKELLSHDLKHTALSNSVNVADSVESMPRVCDLSAEANQDGSRGGLFSSDSSKKDSLESISGRSRASGKKKKKDIQRSSVEKVWEQSVVDTGKNASVDLGDNVGSKCYQNTAPLKCKEDSKTKVGQEATFPVQNETNIPSEMENTLFVGKKKSKGSNNAGKIADSMKESLTLDVSGTPKDTTSSSQSFSSGKSKMNKLKLQKDINKVRDNHRDALDTNFKQKRDKMDPSMRPFHNRPKDAGPTTDFERGHYGSLDKSKEIFSGGTVDNQLLGVDAPGVVPDLSDQTLASQTTALATTASVFIEENWVQCDRCHNWRLLPFDTRPEQLPEKWLCSMLNWLPGMNRCDISEEETTKALRALYQVPVAENQSNPENHANGTMSLVTSAHLQHLDQKNSSFNSQVSSIQGKKNHGQKELPKAGNSGLSLMSNSKKNQRQESLKSRSLKNVTQVPIESNLTKKSSFQQKEKYPVAGVTKQAKMKNKRESGLYANGSSKKVKTEVVYTTDKHQSANLDVRTVGLNSSTGLPTQANGRSMQKYNECTNSGDLKHDLKERSVVSVRKLVDQTQASSDGVSLDMKRCDEKASVKKRKLEDREDSENGNKLYSKEESSESGFRNGKKSRVSKIEGEQPHRNDVDGTSNRKSMDHLIGGANEVRSIDRNQQLRKHKKKSSHKTLDGLDLLRRDSETGQNLKAATSSSSKVSGSHKTRVNFEEARGSPVESVSSSPMRTSYPEKLASTKGEGSGYAAAANTGIPPSGNSRSWDREGTVELAQSVSEMKERVSGDFNPKSHKISTAGCQDRDSIRKISIKTKPSSRLGKSHLHNGDTHFSENGLNALEWPHGEDRVNKECQVVLPQKSDKGYISQTKNNERSSAADKMKVYDPAERQEDLCSRKNMKYQSDVDPEGHACLQETTADCKLNLPKPSKDGKNNVGRRDPSGQWSSDNRMEAQSNKKHEVDAKTAAACSTKGKTAPEKNVIQDFDGQTRQVETRNGISKSSLHCENESQQEIAGHLTAPEAEQGVVSDGFPVNGSDNVDFSKAIKLCGNAGTKIGSNHSLGKHIPDLCVAHSPVRVNSSNQTANDALTDAAKLRNYADRLKSSGFAFESNEIYFKAALKFLGVAARLETSNSESGRHCDLNQMQVYNTASKLCEMCALEYERRREMAATALAYKCMEVAYMRIVYCKQSTSSRDRNELQATLQMVPQGESPSSSASDVDNLNNQQSVEKAPLAKGLVSHVGGTHVIVARNRPSFVRLLDFTQDVSFAMEASRKSQNAFTTATASLEETQNTECIISVRKVIDFSFQDVEGLICLVQQAMEAITRSGLAGARD